MFWWHDYEVVKAMQKEREQAAQHERLVREALAASKNDTLRFSFLRRWQINLKSLFRSCDCEQQALVCC